MRRRQFIGAMSKCGTNKPRARHLECIMKATRQHAKPTRINQCRIATLPTNWLVRGILARFVPSQAHKTRFLSFPTSPRRAHKSPSRGTHLREKRRSVSLQMDFVLPSHAPLHHHTSSSPASCRNAGALGHPGRRFSKRGPRGAATLPSQASLAGLIRWAVGEKDHEACDDSISAYLCKGIFDT